MLKEGGIYNDKYHNDICFIYLLNENDNYYVVDISQMNSNQFSKKNIEEKLNSLNLSSLTYWHSGMEYLSKNIDGYLGQINNNLYNLLCNTLINDIDWLWN